MFPKIDVTIWYFSFLWFPLWWTFSATSVSVGLTFPLWFECVLWWRPCPDNRKLFDRRQFLSAWEPQLDLHYWFVNDFCRLSRYCSAHGCASVSVVWDKFLWLHAQMVGLFLGFWESFSLVSKVAALVYTLTSNL